MKRGTKSVVTSLFYCFLSLVTPPETFAQIAANDSLTTVNIDSLTNATTDPSGISFPAGASAVVVALPAGTYNLVPIATAEGGRFDATQFCTCNNPPKYAYVYDFNTSEQGATVRVAATAGTMDSGYSYSSPEAAVATAPIQQITLAHQGTVKFFIVDNPISDNAGGVSLKIVAVPPFSNISLTGLTGLEPTIGQRAPRLVSLTNGKTVSVYSRLAAAGQQLPTTWHFVFDKSGVTVAPARTWESLDTLSGLNSGTIWPLFGRRRESDGNSAVFAMGHSGHNTNGGRFVVIDGSGSVLTRQGGTGSYATEICSIGQHIATASEYVDPVRHYLHWWQDGTSGSGPTLLDGYGYNYYASEHLVCGQLTSSSNHYGVLIRKQPKSHVGFQLFSVNGSSWQKVGSEARVSASTSAPTVQYYQRNGGAATYREKGVLTYRDYDTDGRLQIFLIRFKVNTNGIQILDTTPRRITASTSLEGQDSHVTIDDAGNFYIATFQAGRSAAGYPANSRQLISAFKLNFESAVLSSIAIPYEDNLWPTTEASYDYTFQDGLAVAHSCDGNLYISAAISTGTLGKRALKILSAPVSTPTCGPPVLTPSISGTLGQGGWYVDDVAVKWTVDLRGGTEQSRSGCSDAVVSSDTVGTTYECTVVSNAGSTTKSVTVKRDATKPAASASTSPSPNANGWHSSNVTTTFSGTDATSGIASCTPAQTISAEGEGQTVSGDCTDQAGNRSASVTSDPVKLDKTPPQISATTSPQPNGTGWNNSAVTVSFAGTDTLSGVAADGCSPASTISNDTKAQTVSGTCVDRAGNGASGSTTVSVDLTAPTVTITTPAQGAQLVQGSTVQTSYACTDDLSGSGVSTCSGTSANGAALSTSTIGSFSFSVTATDVAGNTRTSTSNYSVVAPSYSFTQTPSSLTFANQAINTISTGQLVTIRNTGTGNLSGLTVALSGKTANQFSQSNNCGNALATGASCQITITFKPTTTGTKTANLTVTTTQAGSKTTTLSGSAVAETSTSVSYNVGPSSWNFGRIKVGQLSAEQIFSVTNTSSTTVLAITSITLAGKSTIDFVFSKPNTCGSSLAANATCSIYVQFAPKTTGTKSASVVITPSNSTSKSISLSGSGT